ncbi:IMP dehydrogenase [Malacoplasma iowae]|uniref:GMP reductase n=1 Tax=Malacoplasma iowae DK-CPA TaxID=1394179 RepID=A0A084U3H9_MALIO|nr:IMP dehydrogenase [Malacoplasma iowae]EGZ31671.1 guanosine 5'-monophosphate oxidoreductase [Malacoplasma iowae 695]KFB07515.1 inosine 5'-monophosphate oxidoreductase [Malacoplasma iowae DK-CPA]WPL37657.1 IMP dehydrogenase [Malacoplasma iowae]WPL39324.1 IMP dehydrogenase [Malacoplasma iowae]WPL39599.1 IMP dehydrogenase [Malacoplasma iowae]
MSKNDLLFSIQEVCIYPKAVTNIRTRSQCNPFINGKLPLFTAPMSSVVDEKTYQYFEENKINVIMPRSVPFENRIKFIDKCFVAMGLGETEEYVKKNLSYLKTLEKIYICIDIANGHMKKMQDVIRYLKLEFGNKVVVMCGNIANPETYRYLSESGADYIRVGIGGGSGCLTASNTGIFYPMGSLIVECKKIQMKMYESYKINFTKKPAKIVADGGMKNYDYIIKSLFLGADYVMCGRLFSQCWESPGEIWYKNKNDQDVFTSWNLLGDHSVDKSNLEFRPDIYDYKKIFYGMSTKKAQQEIAIANNEKVSFKTSEGLIKEIPIIHRISGWVENFVSYLTSAMSYTDCWDLTDVKNFNDYRLMTHAAQESYNR